MHPKLFGELAGPREPALAAYGAIDRDGDLDVLLRRLAASGF